MSVIFNKTKKNPPPQGRAGVRRLNISVEKSSDETDSCITRRPIVRLELDMSTYIPNSYRLSQRQETTCRFVWVCLNTWWSFRTEHWCFFIAVRLWLDPSVRRCGFLPRKDLKHLKHESCRMTLLWQAWQICKKNKRQSAKKASLYSQTFNLYPIILVSCETLLISLIFYMFFKRLTISQCAPGDAFLTGCSKTVRFVSTRSRLALTSCKPGQW